MNPKEFIIKAQPKQEEFIEAILSGKYNTGIFGGAMRGGKSWVCCILFILLCKFFPGSKWVIIRKDRPALESTIVPTFNKVVPKNFLVNFNKSKLIATFANGSQIHFIGENIERDAELDDFKGLECNGFFFEQIEEISEKLFELSYIRSMPGSWVIPGDVQPPQLILASCNPSENWIKERFYDKFRAGTLPAKTFYLESKIFDNDVIMASGMVDEIFANLDPVSVRMYRDGDWDAFKYDNAFMYSFDRKKHVTAVKPFYRDLPLILSFDFNVEPLTCIVGQSGNDFLFVIDELQVNPRGSDMIYEMCSLIMEKYTAMLYIVTGDASGRVRTLQSHRNSYEAIQKYLNLTDAQVQVRRQNISLKDSRVLCNSVLHAFPVSIYEGCKTLITECKSAVFEKGILRKNRKDAKLDSLDAFRYMIDYALPDFLEFLKPDSNFGKAQEI